MVIDLLVDERIEAGARFILDYNDFLPVTAAWWIVPADTKNVVLNIASDKFTDENLRDAGLEVFRRLQGKDSHWLNARNVRLIKSADPMVQELIELRDLYAIPAPLRYTGTFLAGVPVDDAYIYPPLHAMKVAS